MRKVLLLLLFVSYGMASYSHDWHQIAKDIYAYQLKHKIFSEDRYWNKRYARRFNLAMSQMDLLQICNAQTGDTLYINEFIDNDLSCSIYMQTSKKDFYYSIDMDSDGKKSVILNIERQNFKYSYDFGILERWDMDEMKRWSDLFSKEVFNGGTRHYIRIVLLEDDEYDIQMFVTCGFYNEEEEDDKSLWEN